MCVCGWGWEAGAGARSCLAASEPAAAVPVESQVLPKCHPGARRGGGASSGQGRAAGGPGTLHAEPSGCLGQSGSSRHFSLMRMRGGGGRAISTVPPGAGGGPMATMPNSVRDYGESSSLFPFVSLVTRFWQQQCLCPCDMTEPVGVRIEPGGTMRALSCPLGGKEE